MALVIHFQQLILVKVVVLAVNEGIYLPLFREVWRPTEVTEMALDRSSATDHPLQCSSLLWHRRHAHVTSLLCAPASARSRWHELIQDRIRAGRVPPHVCKDGPAAGARGRRIGVELEFVSRNLRVGSYGGELR